MKSPLLRAFLLVLCCSPLLAEEKLRVLFDFDADAINAWQAVNDGVMGGRSDGRFKVNDDQMFEFFGTLSLENNGGFASVRSPESKLSLAEGESIIVRVRGDGREYSLNLNVPRNVSRNSYRQSFKTEKGKWIECTLPLDKFVATWRGRVFPDEELDPRNVIGIGILLGDEKAGPFKLEVDWVKAGVLQEPANWFKADCEGTYPHHLQGICTDEEALYWCFTTMLVKTNMEGTLLEKIPVANHHGDLCFQDGKLYVAVNLGRFNDPNGNADSWVYVYDAATLKELARHQAQEVTYGAGGIGFRDGHFFVVGGLPDSVSENYIYEYDATFQFVEKHVLSSGHTHLGIQTATFAHDRWWFGCYGSPKILLVADADFRMRGRFEQDCSLGIEGMSGGRLLVASGRCDSEKGCSGSMQTAIVNEQVGFMLRSEATR